VISNLKLQIEQNFSIENEKIKAELSEAMDQISRLSTIISDFESQSSVPSLPYALSHSSTIENLEAINKSLSSENKALISRLSSVA
jgi:hypothetical protein